MVLFNSHWFNVQRVMVHVQSQALTTGSIPGFVDVVLNFGSSELTEDNLVRKWSESGRKVNMFGDDTWIKLFPGAFLRQDGTTSFYVSDYTEVRLLMMSD